MERKNFILITTAAAAIVAVPMWYYNSTSTEYDPSLVKPQLLSDIWDATTMQEMGNRYLEQHPDETGKSKLTKLLSEGISQDTDAISNAVNQKIKNDYETGNIVTIDGWILSITEGRQCALYALNKSE